MALRSYLAALTIATLLPLAAFAAILGHFLIERERETFQRGVEEHVNAISIAIDSQLRASIATLQAFALSPSLDTGDLAYFRRAASSVLSGQPDWVNINLALPNGQQVVNLLAPQGAKLPNLRAVDTSFERLVEKSQPVVSEMAIGPVTKRWDFAVRVPVFRDGKLKYILSAIVRPDSFSIFLQNRVMPAGWIGLVLDSNARIVARNLNAPRSVGEFPDKRLATAVASSASGWIPAPALEARDYLFRFQRSSATEWVFAVGIPAERATQAAGEAAWMFAGGLLTALAIAVLLALAVARRISQPIARLVEAAEKLRHGQDLPRSETARVREVNVLVDALKSAFHARIEADRQKDEFLAMLSHELRNPIAAITAAADVLRATEYASPGAREAKSIVQRQAQHMARLIEDLVDVSRITMGKLVLQREVFDLATLVCATVEGWRFAGRIGPNHCLTVEASAVWIDADRTRIEQVFTNLLHNAIKFTPQGGRIAVSVRGEDGQAVLRVADSGRGVAAERLARIFEPFVQGEHTTPSREEGLGIGLTLVKRLAELHGGAVAVDSPGPGKGATFTVRLPAVAAASVAHPPQDVRAAR